MYALFKETSHANFISHKSNYGVNPAANPKNWVAFDGQHVHYSTNNLSSITQELVWYFRQTAGTKNSQLYNDRAAITNIKGNTIAWNQIFYVPSSDKSQTRNGVTLKDYRNGAYSISFTSNPNTTVVFTLFNVECKATHKYLLYLYGYGDNIECDIAGYSNWTGILRTSAEGVIGKCNNNYTGNMEIIVPPMTKCSRKIYPQVFDLTAMYGKGNEPTSLAKFKEDYFNWFGIPLTFEPYDKGSLRNVKMTGIKTQDNNLGIPNGFSLLNYLENTNNAYIDLNEDYIFGYQNFTLEAQLTAYPSTWYGALIGNRDAPASSQGFCWYLQRADSSTTHNILTSIHTSEINSDLGGHNLFDGNFHVLKTVLNRSNGTATHTIDGYSTTISGFTTSTCDRTNVPYRLFVNNNGMYFKGKVCYLKITVGSTLKYHFLPVIRNSDNSVGMYDIVSGKFYNHSGSTNFVAGQIIDNPYESSIRVTSLTSDGTTIFPDGLKSAGTARDEIYGVANGARAIKRIATVNLGTLNWSTNNPSSGVYYHEAYISNIKQTGATTNRSNISCPKYSVILQNSWQTNTPGIFVQYASNYIVIADNQYTSASTFKTAMNNIYLNYEMTSPINYLIDNFQLPKNYKIWKDGSEQICTHNGIVNALDISSAPLITTEYNI